MRSTSHRIPTGSSQGSTLMKASGTKKEIRPALMKLIADCEDGKVEYIVTKSLSRFARNTTDCLELIRKLLDLGVAVYFEKEYIQNGENACFEGFSPFLYARLSLICRLNLQTDTER